MRKLPPLWLVVSITETVAVPGIFDMMMRPGSPTTFSNFDHLTTRCRPLPGFPAEAVLRTDRRGVRVPAGHHRRPSRHLRRRARQGAADHAEGRAHRLAAGGGRTGALRRVPAGRIRRCRARSGADREAAAVGVGASRRHQPARTASRMTDAATARARSIRMLVLGAAIVLPASGHVAARRAGARPAVSFLHGDPRLGHRQDRAAGASFVGRHAGGFLIYALSILDAYRIARVRYAKWVLQRASSKMAREQLSAIRN